LLGIRKLTIPIQKFLIYSLFSPLIFVNYFTNLIIKKEKLMIY